MIQEPQPIWLKSTCRSTLRQGDFSLPLLDACGLLAVCSLWPRLLRRRRGQRAFLISAGDRNLDCSAVWSKLALALELSSEPVCEKMTNKARSLTSASLFAPPTDWSRSDGPLFVSATLDLLDVLLWRTLPFDFCLSQFRRGDVMLKTFQLCDDVTREDWLSSPTSCCCCCCCCWQPLCWWWTSTVMLATLCVRGSLILSSAAWICLSASRACRSKVAIQRRCLYVRPDVAKRHVSKWGVYAGWNKWTLC